MSDLDDDFEEALAYLSPLSWGVTDDRVAAFKRWLRENDLALISTNGRPPADLVYRLESFFAELE